MRVNHASELTSWHKTVPVGPKKHWTELRGIDATTDGGAELQVVIVPGNPGSALFYLPFIEYLHDELGGKADVLVFSHLAHDLRSKHGDMLVSLEDQIQHKVDIFKDLILTEGKPPTIVLGHSIGGYMLLHAMPQLQAIAEATSTEIIKAVCLFPFLEADFDLPRVRSLNIISKYHSALGILGGVLGCLPHFMTACIFRSAAKDSLHEHAVNTCCNLLTKATLRQYFYLASCYVVKKPFNWDLVTSLPNMLIMYACPNDTWMPETLYKYICKTMPEVDVRWREEMAHAFIVSDERSKLAAKLVADVVASVVPVAHSCKPASIMEYSTLRVW